MINEKGVEELPIKKMKTELYSNKALLMMQKMGYENDKGLGKANQGRLEPVQAVHQDGRKGFGLKLSSGTKTDDEWDESLENYSIPEPVNWIKRDPIKNLKANDFKNYLKMGTKKLSLEGEDLFCSPEILKLILDSKSMFDDINENELRRARSRSNPFETIRSSIFLNRAAVKMANMDSMLDFMFTNPKDIHGQSLLEGNELLYFADICAGPGGFSEYILFRTLWHAKGFGFTLKGTNDFKLDKFTAGPPESFDPFYGDREDGDIFYESNQNSFAEYIRKHCEKGVHFAMADGGFSVEGQENIQEILSKQLYLCQCLTALKILRTGGHFICKLFDIFTRFSVGLIFLMYNSFAEITIIKPNSSRPANSERYLVCKGKLNNTTAICEYMNTINNKLNDQSIEDIVEIVDLNEILEDEDFSDFIKKSNNDIGKYQIIGLRKILAFCKNNKLTETHQSEYRNKCLKLWKLPERPRQPPESKSIEKTLDEILGVCNDKFLTSPAVELLSSNDLKHIASILDWYFVAIGRGETKLNTCSIFLCKVRGQLLRFSDTRNWEQVDSSFDVIPKSLFFGEIVYECIGEGRNQTRVCALHIIDAIMLGGIPVGEHHISIRNKLCQKYCHSINKPYNNSNRSGLIRAKPLFKLKSISKFFDDMRAYTLKDNSRRLGYSLYPNKFFVPGGFIFLPCLSHNFISKLSKSTKKIYYFDKSMNQSYYEEQLPSQVRSILYETFSNSFRRRLLWKWTHICQVEKELRDHDNNLLCRYQIENFVKCFQNT